jgi:cobalamin biosynthesis protein CobT
MKDNFIRALPLVASALGRKYGVKVIIGGQQAFSDDSNIFLPALPLDSPPELVSLARGYLDHEAAHIRETDFALARAANLTPLEKHVWNMIEDWRAERLLGEKYPGCRQNFAWLIKRFFDQDCQSADLEKAILNWLLLTLRSWSVPELGTRVSELAGLVESQLPGLIARLNDILDVLRNDCSGTKDSLKYAAQIVQTLSSYEPEQPPAQNSRNQISPGVKDNQDANSQETGSTSAAEPSNQPEASGQSSSEHDSASEILTDSDFDQNSQAVQSAIPDKTDGSSNPASIIRSLLNKSAGELPESFDRMMESCLNSAHQGRSYDRLAVAQAGPLNFSELSAQDLESIRTTALALKGRLQSLLQTMTLRADRPGYRGKLDTNSLHKLLAGQPKIFRRAGTRTGLDTAVHLLVDISGSMTGMTDLASLAAYSLCEALHSVPGINAAATAFPGKPVQMKGQREPNPCTVAPILGHGEPLHRRFSLYSSGGTPLGEAVWWVVQRFSRLRESRKIIIVVTDGVPDSEPNALAAIEEARRMGIEIYGLGLRNEAVKELLPGSSFVLYSLAELPEKLFRLLETAINQRSG